MCFAGVGGVYDTHSTAAYTDDTFGPGQRDWPLRAMRASIKLALVYVRYEQVDGPADQQSVRVDLVGIQAR